MLVRHSLEYGVWAVSCLVFICLSIWMTGIRKGFRNIVIIYLYCQGCIWAFSFVIFLFIMSITFGENREIHNCFMEYFRTGGNGINCLFINYSVLAWSILFGLIPLLYVFKHIFAAWKSFKQVVNMSFKQTAFAFGISFFLCITFAFGINEVAEGFMWAGL